MLHDSDNYIIKLDSDYSFAADALRVTVVRRDRERGGYYPLSIDIEEGAFVPFDFSAVLDNEPPSTSVPRELAESLLAALARCLLSADGDLVAENRNLKNRLERTTQQLEKLIAGIGRLGGA